MTTALPREYAAEPYEGGYRISRVPIFAEHERTFKGRGGEPVVVKVDRQRLERIAKNYNNRVKQDGWKGPIHGAHNGNGATGPRLGYLDNYRVEKSTYNGEPTYVLFADYIIDNTEDMSADERLREIKRYPYRSVEINLQKDEASSLALLDREAPYFKFPIFQVNGVDFHGCDATTEYGVGYALYGERYSVITYSEGPPMKDGKDKDMGDKAQKDKSPMAGMRAEWKAFMDSCKKDYESYMGRMQKFAEEVMAEDEEEEDVEDSKSKGKSKRYQDKASKDRMADKEEEPAAVMNSADTSHYSEALANERAERRALERRLEAMEEANNKQRILQEAADAVADYNIDTESFLEDCLSFYNEGGESAVRAYVTATKNHGETTHYSDDDGDDEDAGVSVGLPDEVAQYAGDAQKLDAASRLYSEFDSLPRAIRTSISREDYIATHIDGKLTA